MNSVITGGYKLLTETGNVSPIATDLLGIFVSAASSTPTITIYNSSTTGTSDRVVNTFTPVSATYYTIPASLGEGLYIVVGGNVSATVFFG
jgi:hypothetical protein